MQKNDQLKCLFGHHKYDEDWLVSGKFSGDISRKFVICTICRESAIWEVFHTDSEKLIVRIGVHVVEETDKIFKGRWATNAAGIALRLTKDSDEAQRIVHHSSAHGVFDLTP